jgi:hypothetical protein
MRSCLLPIGIGLALVTPGAADERHTVEFIGKGRLAVVGGRVCVVPPTKANYDWGLIRGGIAASIRVLKPEAWRGRYLAYDPRARDPTKDNGVYLADQHGPGTAWEQTLLKGEDDGDYVIQAAAGPLKGWYLDVADQPETVRDSQGRPQTVYPVFLSQKPKRLPKVDLIPVAP